MKVEHNMPLKRYRVRLITVKIRVQYFCKHGRVNEMYWHHVRIPLNTRGDRNVMRYISCSCVCKSVLLLMIGTSFGNCAFKISKCETNATVTVCFVTLRKRKRRVKAWGLCQ